MGVMGVPADAGTASSNAAAAFAGKATDEASAMRRSTGRARRRS